MEDRTKKRERDLVWPSLSAMDRRERLSATILASGTLLCGLDLILSPQSSAHTQNDPFAGAKLLGTVEFTGEGKPPMDQPVGEELDGRLFTDLSGITPDNSVIPTDRFYIRTRASQLLDLRKPWAIRLGRPGKPVNITMHDLVREAEPQGLHLRECAGNSLSAHFGMIGVADWAGVPLGTILDRALGSGRDSRVLISGFDIYATKTVTSVPGASWIFAPNDLHAAGAFLATQMNSKPLTRDHGDPVRLIVPNWYGCTCIKWVDEISFANDAAPTTSQMKEYASRTHQQGTPELARDYEPAVLDPAAMPIRIEKWIASGRLKYRVVGIVWGGTQAVKTLTIQFNPGESYIPVEMIRPATSNFWGFWSCTWTPQRPGTYAIRMRVADSGVRTRRLDNGFYARSVEIREI